LIPFRKIVRSSILYNRWGELIFHSKKWEERWDGKTSAEKSLLPIGKEGIEDVPIEVYQYIIRYDDGTCEDKEETGVVTVIRPGQK